MSRHHRMQTVLILALILVVGRVQTAAAAQVEAPVIQRRDAPIDRSGLELLQGSALPTPSAPIAPVVVRAVMLWMEGCGNCHYVIEEVLPPLQQKYGDRLEIVLVELKTRQDVDFLYQVGEKYQVPKDEVGVPMLLIGDRVLVGSVQIPDELPGLIERYLAFGGAGYPAVEGLAAYLPAGETIEGLCDPVVPCEEEAAAPVVVEPTAAVPPASNGFTLAVVVLAGMVASLFISGGVFARGIRLIPVSANAADWGTPVLALLGLGVAVYLAYVETQPVSAICGPIGDCNTVQNSPYATLFGVLPVGVLGTAGYAGILAAWAVRKWGPKSVSRYASLAIFGMAVFGTLFSVYLTYLEPFVIKAVCAWCLTSAVIITLLMLTSAGDASRAWKYRTENKAGLHIKLTKPKE